MGDIIEGDGIVTLHWDGKMLKPLTHVGEKEERIAIILYNTDTKEEVLMGIPKLKDGKADTTVKEIDSTLKNFNVPHEKIDGVVFDTTSVNSGCNNGIVVQLEHLFGKKLLQLACRHHIAELIAGAACKEVYGETDSPKERCFVALTNFWPEIETSGFKMPVVRCRYLKRMQKDAVSVLEELSTSAIRKDYRELCELALIINGGDHTKIIVRPPGAQHHARWMAKIIYTLKIAIYKDQLKNIFASEFLENIEILAIFLSIFYVPYWFAVPSATDAPLLDLEMLSTLEMASLKTSGLLNSIVLASFEKMKKHLWYLSERLVLLSLFSPKVQEETKRSIVKKLKSYKRIEETSEQNMPLSNFSACSLSTFVGKDSLTFIKMFRMDDLISVPISMWPRTPLYLKLFNQFNVLPVINDSCERALGLLTTLHQSGKVPKDEDQKQYLLNVVKNARSHNKSLVNKGKPYRERITKETIKEIKYENM